MRKIIAAVPLITLAAPAWAGLDERLAAGLRDNAAALRKTVDALDSDPAFQMNAARVGVGTRMELVKGADARRFVENIGDLVRKYPDAVQYPTGFTGKKKWTEAAP